MKTICVVGLWHLGLVNSVGFATKWEEFMKAVTTRREPLGNGLDGLRAMKIVDAVYAASKTGRIFLLK